MDHSVLVAALALVGTLVGTFGGILAANRLTNYRIEQLEKKVEKHNNIYDRQHLIEQELAVLKEKIAEMYHSLDDLRKGRTV